jgi:hypothetical protein
LCSSESLGTISETVSSLKIAGSGSDVKSRLAEFALLRRAGDLLFYDFESSAADYT